MFVKICGLKTLDMLQTAIEAGADYVGLVFFEKSPRHVALEEAASLATAARGQTKIVALVVDETDETLTQIANSVQPDYFQLHGAEPPARAQEIFDQFQIPLIKALGVQTAEDVQRADDYPMADIILFDAKPSPHQTQLPGGNGIAFDWNLLHEQRLKRTFMLSGGLTPLNVAEAIQLTGAMGVDTSSGVERARGVKDPRLIKDFIQCAKQMTD